MDGGPNRVDEEEARRLKRVALKELNINHAGQEPSKALDSSLKRHTALIKRMRQSLGSENHAQVLKDLESLSLEKYVDEISSAAVEGIGRCKTEKDVWSAVEIISALHRRFPSTFTPGIISALSAALAPPPRASISVLAPEQKDKEDSSRISRQRPVLRVCAELALIGIIRDSPTRSGGEWIMKVVKELLSNDPTLSSLPLLSTFLKSYSRPYLGIVPPTPAKQISAASEPVTLSEEATKSANGTANNGSFPSLTQESDELVEKDIRDRFKKMCEGYFDSVCKKLVIEHNRLQDQDRKNHEAYIRSGEIFEDRQQAYEKMTKGYEKLLASCQTLSELLYLPLPELKTATQKTDSIQIGTNSRSLLGGDADADEVPRGGKWEDEEERRFFEDIPDLKDYVPKGREAASDESKEAKEQLEKERVEAEVRKLEEELADLEVNDEGRTGSTGGSRLNEDDEEDEADEDGMATPTPGSPNPRHLVHHNGASRPSQLLTALLARLPDATNRALIDQAAVDFAFLNSKQLGSGFSKSADLLPHYSRFIAILNKYMPDIGNDILDEEFRYLQRKKNVSRSLRKCAGSEDTHQPFSRMIELMRRKQSAQHLDQRQLLLLENAYYQRTARQEKERTPMELFIRHLIYDETRLEDEGVRRTLHKVFTKPWKVKYSNIALLAMLTYDLSRYYPAFTIAVVDQVLEDIRRGLEQNVYNMNQRRLATIKYLGELYIYRLFGSSIIFDTFWSLVTFGHPEGRPLPGQATPLDMPDDYFRVRLVCVLLDTCGMCFDRGPHLKRLDNFLTFFQMYVLCKNPLPMDVEFMLSDSIEAVRPKAVIFKTFEEAAIAVDEMFNVALQNAGLTTGDDSGDDDDDDEDVRRDADDEEDGDGGPESPTDERAPSPEAVLLKSGSLEVLGPSEEDDAEFAKELAKMVTDTADARKVDKKTALALWDQTVPPPVVRKKRGDDAEDGFTLFTKRGNKPQMKQLAIPAESALAVQTRTAQLQDKVEQQHLKRLVLDYEQREEAEELRALEARNRAGAIKIRYVG
ncbi:hypothetical protein BC629DRAFT_1472459 [Irpex lacteus]|nr:hypothetical protein BC629DRAFT_1472459 [Irpex lacteus]